MGTEKAQIEVTRLGSVYNSLGTALTEAGLTGAQLNEVFAKSVQVKCTLCGATVTGEELGQLALAGAEGELADARLDRLRRGYCAKLGCESSYYEVEFAEHPGVAWAKVRERASELAAGAERAAGAAEDEQRMALARKRRKKRVGIGVGVLLVVLILRFITYYGYIPLLQRPGKYGADPASVKHPVER